MQKIVIDTNVIVSSLIQKSYPFKIMHELYLEDKFLLCLSDELMHEYYNVISRPKFSKFPEFLARAESLLAFIDLHSMKFSPKEKIHLISDVNDNKILELADECSANFIITGNTNDFTFSEYKETKIVSTRIYWEQYLPITD